ncbi:DUF7336 domain-containing protein [Nitrospirillum iridis]|uniref:DUF7336 domain-containing protein n=1 Tax=Nitrospirillum iridis TaxID=765888 RepID=A0A7X0AUS0_9PROT|nr:serine kinase [Nitrospirillum iridis]MBB6250463.1 hypothetical protein [Nitrospirillum iridis]
MKTVYILYHCYSTEYGENQKMIGVFSDYGKCQHAIEEISGKPGFIDHIDGFNIVEIQMDKIKSDFYLTLIED